MPRLKWGADDMFWGDQALYWGATGDTVPVADQAFHDPWVHWLIKITLSPTETVRAWTGRGMLEITEEDGSVNEWAGGGQAISVGNISSHTTPSSSRLEIQLNVIPDEYRGKFVTPVGPAAAEARTIVSTNYGIAWRVLPQVKRGLMNNPRMRGGTYRFEIVHPFEVRQRVRPLTWSHEDQIARYPGDTGMAFMRQLAGGVEATWPHITD